MSSALATIAETNRQHGALGICSVCTIHPIVLAAAMRHANEHDYSIVIETTANQVNQYGGYSGLQPKEAYEFISAIATDVGLDSSRLILGGDHLGPVCWTDLPADEAMQRAERLVGDYVRAGFQKIHLDCSMPCLDDPNVLDDEAVATRAARLCAVAEEVLATTSDAQTVHYIIGTEVPPPGGAADDMAELQVTRVESARTTIDVHRQAFKDAGVDDAWERVIGLVVQPGVEFDHVSIHDFDSNASRELSEFVLTVPRIVFEAHSTDYQLPTAYKSLVEQHFAILKVGPQLTFALREAIFALSHIEEAVIEPKRQSHVRQVCEEVMLDRPESWSNHYSSKTESEQLLRRFSLSDRIRYYWNDPKIGRSVDRLIENLTNTTIPLPLISQYFPVEYQAVRTADLRPCPLDLIEAHIKQVLDDYAFGCLP